MAKVHVVFSQAEDISAQEALAFISLEREKAEQAAQQMNDKHGPTRRGGRAYLICEVELDGFAGIHDPEKYD